MCVGGPEGLLTMACHKGYRWKLAHLGVGVNGVEEGAGVGVPELDGAVGRATPGGQQVGLEGAPRQRLDGSRVRGQAMQRCTPSRAPHMQQVVVAAAR